MIPLNEQRAFIRGELAKLGAALQLDGLDRYADELEADQSFKAKIEAQVADVDFFRTKHWDSILRLGLYRFAQYAMVRAVKPKGVIETGVLHGLSTVFPLAALARNAGEAGCGRMISIDAPSTFERGPSNQDGFHDTLPPSLGPGWVIPDDLRPRWQLEIGTSREHLTGALAKLERIGLFIHDSEHTAETMLFEFETAWPALADGGILLADNIDVNTSFFDFARGKGRVVHVLPIDPDHAVPGASGIRCGLLRK
jgi:cephalosporin hydroxylase